MAETELSYSDVNRVVLRTLASPGRKYWTGVGLLAALVVMGGATWMYQVWTGLGVTGLRQPNMWAVYITSFVFWVGIAHSGTLISAILFLCRTRWRTPVYRAAETMTVFAVMTAGLFPLIHLGRVWFFYWLMPYPNQRTLWPNFRSPLLWDVFAVSTYLTVSATFFIVGLIPDIAAARDQAKTWFRRLLYSITSLGWSGSHSQWKHYTAA